MLLCTRRNPPAEEGSIQIMGMHIKRAEDAVEFIANDGCRIRELLHPKNDPVALPYSLAICRVEPLGRTHRHRLGATEVYYILGGRGRLWTEGDAVELGVGDAAVVPALAAQWIENPGAEELRFAVLVSPPWALDQDQRLE